MGFRGATSHATAKPGAPEALRGRPIGLAELLEQLGLLLRRHADPGVGHGELVATVRHLGATAARLPFSLSPAATSGVPIF